MLFDRKMLRNFRKDGHNWKKKKDGKTVKEAHEHLKVWYSLAFNMPSTEAKNSECLFLWEKWIYVLSYVFTPSSAVS